jgi:hypothetical protein
MFFSHRNEQSCAGFETGDHLLIPCANLP